MASFTCQDCGKTFEVSDTTLANYPGWKPKRCLNCKNKQTGTTERNRTPIPREQQGVRLSAATLEENLTVSEVLAKYKAGPKAGVFTDGAADPNPGPGGWGAVYVIDDQILAERWGHEPHTTNNRMELSALIAGVSLVPEGTPAIVYTDSQLCVSTITKWAQGWEARGWRRKSGEIKNLELVQELYGLFKRRPELELRWIAAHSGYRWNEYADSLATAYRRAQR